MQTFKAWISRTPPVFMAITGLRYTGFAHPAKKVCRCILVGGDKPLKSSPPWQHIRIIATKSASATGVRHRLRRRPWYRLILWVC